MTNQNKEECSQETYIANSKSKAEKHDGTRDGRDCCKENRCCSELSDLSTYILYGCKSLGWLGFDKRKYTENRKYKLMESFFLSG